MTRKSVLFALSAAALSVALLGAAAQDDKRGGDPETERIIRGFQIAPVHLNLRGKDRNMVGLGSYIVNAQSACSDCHTNPQFTPGHDPYLGEPAQINTARYLAGGRSFGPVISANITPDEDGKPAGLTFPEFRNLIRTGHDPDDPDEILQVMPWPYFRNMNDHELKAIYAYLSAIPHVDD